MSSIAVIIATYNRAPILRGALEALAAQEDPGVPVTIAVADNGSTDDTHAVFEEVRSRAPRFTWLYLWEPRPGKSSAVNRAIACTSAEWVAFTDDDVRPEPNWLAALAQAFAVSSADFLVGRILPIWERALPAWFSTTLNGALGVPDNGPVACSIGFDENEHIMPIGTNMAVRREAIARAGGMRADLGKLRGTLRSGEDHELALRLLHHGCWGLYVPDARVHHLVPAARLTRDYFRRWFYQNARNTATLEAAWPRRTPMLFAVPRYLWRQAAASAMKLLRAALARNSADRFRHAIALLWFAGYVRESWFGRTAASAGPTGRIDSRLPEFAHRSSDGRV